MLQFSLAQNQIELGPDQVLKHRANLVGAPSSLLKRLGLVEEILDVRKKRFAWGEPELNHAASLQATLLNLITFSLSKKTPAKTMPRKNPVSDSYGAFKAA